MKEIRLPKEWNEWKVEGIIGSGSAGDVYKIRHTQTKETQAVKVVHFTMEDITPKEELYCRMTGKNIQTILDVKAANALEEARIMRKFVGKKKIVQIYDYCLEKDEEAVACAVYIRMELLKQITEKQNAVYKETEVVKMGMDICEALMCCEQEGILHGDIKPQNIFMRPDDGSYVLGDFGEAISSENTDFIKSRGSAAYAAPEVTCRGEHSIQSEIYALGMTLYHLANKSLDPFMEEQDRYSRIKRMNALQKRLAGSDIPAPLDASPELADVILKACAYYPADRYQTFSEFSNALMGIQNLSGL